MSGSTVIQATAFARAGLVGNPSDIFNGKVISLLFDHFRASVKLYETPHLTIVPGFRDRNSFGSLTELVRYRRCFGYYGGTRLIEAIIVRFKSHCDENRISLHDRKFSIEYDSSIPFAVGLGGSSAIIRAALSALMQFYGLSDRDIPKAVQPELILGAETEELDISAGLQDRVVATYGGLVYMDFTKDAYARNGGLHGEYRKLDPKLLPPLFVAYKDSLAKSSGAVHNIMRYRVYVEHDARISEVMAQKALLADELKEQLLAGNKEALGPIISRDFDLRKSVYAISAENLRMVEIARAFGSHANQTGSGGAVIGTLEGEEQFAVLQHAYGREGFRTVPVRLAEVEQMPSSQP